MPVPAPIRQPMLNERGLITNEWADYLRTLDPGVGADGGDGDGTPTPPPQTITIGGGGTVDVDDNDLLASIPLLANAVLTTDVSQHIAWSQQILWENLPTGIGTWNATVFLDGLVVGSLAISDALTVTRLTTPASPPTNMTIAPSGDLVLDPASGKVTLDNMLLIGTTTAPAVGTSGVVFGDGTALASMASNTAGFYADDVGGTVRMHAIDEAGVTGQVPMLVSWPTVGSVLFAAADGRVNQDNANLFWDDTNNRLGIGINTPGSRLHVAGKVGINHVGLGGTALDVFGASGGGTVVAVQSNGAVNGDSIVSVNGNGTGTLSGFSASLSASNLASIYLQQNHATGHGCFEVVVLSAGDPFMRFQVSGIQAWSCGLDNSDSDKFKIGTGTTLGASDYLVITTTGSVGIGTATPNTTLDVFGTVSVREFFALRWGTSGVAQMIGASGGSGYLDFYTFGSGVARFAPSAKFLFGNTFATTGTLNQSNSVAIQNSLGVGTNLLQAGGTNTAVFADGTAPSSMPADTAGIYADDVAGTVKMFVITEAGVSGQIATVTDLTAYQPLDAELTALAALANAAGVLTNNGAGVLSWVAGGGGGVSGTGTTGKLPKWSSSSALADSIVTETTGLITIAGALTINGPLRGAWNGTAASDGNLAFGVSTLTSLTSAVRNTAVGYSALQSVTSGGYNTAVGVDALKSLVISGNCVAVGALALQANTGNSNVAVGVAALYANTTGERNVAVGPGNVLAVNLTGTDNVAVGNQAMSVLATSVSQCVAIGARAQERATGSYNIGIGFAALYQATGNSNVGVGDSAGGNITSGSSNVCIGNGTGGGITTGIGNTIIGANVTGLAAGLTNTIIIADGSGNQRLYIDSVGKVGIGTTVPSVLLHVKTTSGSPADAVIEVTNTSIQATVQAKSNGATLNMTAYGSTHGGTYAGTSFNSLSVLESGGAHLMVSYDAGHVLFVNGTIETARLTHNGNFLTGTTAEPGTGTMAHIFGDGTAPASMGTNTAGIYADDVAGTVKMFVITEAGVSGQIATLADIPASLVTGSGTTGTLSKWTSASALGATAITEASGNLGIGGAPVSNVRVDITGTTTGANQWSLYIRNVIDATATGTQLGIYIAQTTAASALMSIYAGYRVDNLAKGAGATLNYHYGLWVTDLSSGALGNYALRLSVSAGAGKYNINADGTADNSLAGALYVGGGGGSTSGPALDVRSTWSTQPVGFKVEDQNGYGVYVSNENTFNFNYGVNADSGGYLNYQGYQNGTTRFRSLIIADGKTNSIATFNGSDSKVTFHAVGVVHSFNGYLSVNTVGTVASGFGDGLYIAGWNAMGWDGVNGLVLGGYRAGTWQVVKVYAGASGGVSLSAGATAWAAISDVRHKNILAPLGEDALAKLGRLTPVYYALKDDPHQLRHVGLIAQEVQAVLPEAVTADDDGTLTLRYTDVIPLLVSAFHETSRRLAALEGHHHGK